MHSGTQIAGQMTAVMRATRALATDTAPKVLRIGIVRAGRIVEERIIKKRTTVSVGSSEEATFVIASPLVPPLFKLFERTGNDYVLRFVDGATGRLALASGVTDLDGARAQAKSANGVYQLKLPDDARGKIVLGDTTFLFQFVRPPPPQPRPQLPLAVKGGVGNQIDWALTIIAAVSFLLHFGVVGAMYSDWMDRIVGEEHTVAGLIDMMQKIPPPAATEIPLDAYATPTTVAPPTPTTTTASNTPTKTATPSGGGTRGGPSVDAKQAAALVSQAERIEVDLLAGLGGKTAVDSALKRSEIPPVDLSAPAAANVAVAHGTGDLSHGNSGPVAAGRNNSLATLGGPTRGNADGNAGDTRTVAIPKFDTQIGGVGATNVTNADRTIAALKSRFRICYQKGLASDPTMGGKVVIAAKVSPNGEVASTGVTSNSGLSNDVATCIASAIQRAQFDAPGPAGATISIPVTFYHQ